MWPHDTKIPEKVKTGIEKLKKIQIKEKKYMQKQRQRQKRKQDSGISWLFIVFSFLNQMMRENVMLNRQWRQKERLRQLRLEEYKRKRQLSKQKRVSRVKNYVFLEKTRRCHQKKNWPRHINVILHIIILTSSPTYNYSSRL